MGTFRTPQSQAAYDKILQAGVSADGCPLCNAKSILEFNLWHIVVNAYPYDKIASVHHMLISKRHASEYELTAEEKDEFESIKREYVHKNYEFLIETSHKKKTTPEHMHLHLVIAKE